jgi:hypothetical protein
MVRFGVLSKDLSSVAKYATYAFGGVLVLAVGLPFVGSLTRKPVVQSTGDVGTDFVIREFVPSVGSEDVVAGSVVIRHRGKPTEVTVGFRLGQRIPIWPANLYRQVLDVGMEKADCDFRDDADWQDYVIELGPPVRVPWYDQGILGQSMDVLVYVKSGEKELARRWFDSALTLVLF